MTHYYHADRLSADVLQVETAVDRFIYVRTLSDETSNRADEIQESSELERGECTAIALAEAEDARCLTDDHAARKTAQSLGVEVGGTIYVLLEALDPGCLSFEEYVDELDTLTDDGFRMSASLYRKVVKVSENLTD